MMRIKLLSISVLEPNTGQVENLPRNPRQWSVRDVTRLRQSIEDTPELLEARPLLVVKHGSKFVCLGGNMRLQALQELSYESVPCIVLPTTLSATKLKEIVIKDNSQFGDWDYKALEEEWGDFPLEDFGITVYDYKDSGRSNARPDKIDDRKVLEIELTPEEFYFVTGKLRAIAETPEEAVLKLLNYGR